MIRLSDMESFALCCATLYKQGIQFEAWEEGGTFVIKLTGY